MARGDTEIDFKAAAAADGITLTQRYQVPWATERGHFGLPESAAAAAGPLHGILLDLGGDSAAYAAGRPRMLSGDLLHQPTGTIIEVDELQHFTTWRARTLDAYPDTARLGFDADEYRALIRRHAAEADGYRNALQAKGFEFAGGRSRQRAYYDALRDLGAPAVGVPPVIRVPAIRCTGASAYASARDRIRAAISL